jgi:hypothetical protein
VNGFSEKRPEFESKAKAVDVGFVVGKVDRVFLHSLDFACQYHTTAVQYPIIYIVWNRGYQPMGRDPQVGREVCTSGSPFFICNPKIIIIFLPTKAAMHVTRSAHKKNTNNGKTFFLINNK